MYPNNIIVEYLLFSTLCFFFVNRHHEICRDQILGARFLVLHLQQWLFGLRLANAFGGSSCDAVHSLQRLRLGAGNVTRDMV